MTCLPVSALSFHATAVRMPLEHTLRSAVGAASFYDLSPASKVSLQGGLSDICVSCSRRRLGCV